MYWYSLELVPSTRGTARVILISGRTAFKQQRRPRPGTQWGPVVDGVLLPQSPLQMLAEGKISKQKKKVPVLMGSNADEGTTFLSQGASSPAELAEWCNHTFGPAIGGAVRRPPRARGAGRAPSRPAAPVSLAVSRALPRNCRFAALAAAPRFSLGRGIRRA